MNVPKVQKNKKWRPVLCSTSRFIAEGRRKKLQKVGEREIHVEIMQKATKNGTNSAGWRVETREKSRPRWPHIRMRE